MAWYELPAATVRIRRSTVCKLIARRGFRAKSYYEQVSEAAMDGILTAGANSSVMFIDLEKHVDIAFRLVHRVFQTW